MGLVLMGRVVMGRVSMGRVVREPQKLPIAENIIFLIISVVKKISIYLIAPKGKGAEGNKSTMAVTVNSSNSFNLY